MTPQQQRDARLRASWEEDKPFPDDLDPNVDVEEYLDDALDEIERLERQILDRPLSEKWYPVLSEPGEKRAWE